MENEVSAVVPSDEGISSTAAGEDLRVEDGTILAAPDLEKRTEAGVPDTDAAPIDPLAGMTPEERARWEQVPPELRPDADGKPPVLTEALMAKLRSKYFTVRHPRVTECGHRFDMVNEPRNNCELCWINFFAYHPQLVETADQFFRTQGKNPMIAMRGKKFFKYFTRFMVTLLREKEAREAQLKEQNVSRNQESRLGDGTICVEA